MALQFESKTTEARPIKDVASLNSHFKDRLASA